MNGCHKRRAQYRIQFVISSNNGINFTKNLLSWISRKIESSRHPLSGNGFIEEWNCILYVLIYFETLENLNIVFLYYIEFWKKAGLICHNFCLQIYVHSKVKNVVICQEFSANENSTKEICTNFFFSPHPYKNYKKR